MVPRQIGPEFDGSGKVSQAEMVLFMRNMAQHIFGNIWSKFCLTNKTE